MPSEFLYNLTKNLTAYLRHYLCAVLPKKSRYSLFAKVVPAFGLSERGLSFLMSG